MTQKVERTLDISVVAIDDDESSLEFVREALSCFDLTVHCAPSAKEGRRLIHKHHPRIVILDEHLPDAHGVELLQDIVREDPAIEVLLLTAEYSTDLAVRAIKLGAADYLTKPITVDALCARMRPIVNQIQKRREIANLDVQLLQNFEFSGMLSRSPAMLEVFAKIQRVSRHFQAVLVEGETGTGKELVARALHQGGAGEGKPFVACNCSSIPESLIESELFGHVKGSFTGAQSDKIGLFQAANGGTILLDEIGDMPLQQQARLLRVLQNREVRRVGSNRSEPIDVRVVAATHRSLADMVRRGEFREDLYYRLSAIEISLPPLRDRKEDLPMLFQHFVNKSALEFGKDVRGISRRAQAVLTKYSWPGNIRELGSAIFAACMMCDKPFVDVDDLPDRIRGAQASPLSEHGESEWESLKALQARHAAEVLDAVDGNKLQAAKILGVSRTTLYKLLDEHESEPAEGGVGLAWGSTQVVIGRA